MDKLTRAELAKLLTVDPSTISRHKKAGMPVNEDGKTFNGPECVQWVIGRVELAASKDPGETDESRKWLTAFRRERAKKAKIERLQQEGTLMDVEEINQQWIGQAMTYKNSLRAFSKAGPRSVRVPLKLSASALATRSVVSENPK